MADYYRKNPEKFRLTPEGLVKRNEANRNRYATDPEFRAKCLEFANRAVRSGRARQLKRASFLKSIGLSEESYATLYAEQGGKCAICDVYEDRLRPDHCHKSGKARGLLCTRCNLALGQFGDSLDRLQRAVVYLGRYGLRARRNRSRTD
ncbi:MAG: endonuclease VII domain-containing protein [Pseudomonadota bacterium]|nr:endonuclease VII domain-containing protein [Pseudomonadota bacterium]